MAASDPTSSVPTPTGTLQGCAAFSWDGSTWQPAGAAYASVATPTGVLRGVAPFSYSGGVWTPTGRAMPSVATPTGVLDGVALYTWSGTAWVPTPTGSDAPTPSGTLRGIAAFYWDGSNWQPAGQAAPDVPTPGGVLQGVALFNWSGSAWVAATAGPVPALDLNFLTMTTLDARLTFTRASVATYFDNTGTMQTAAANVARLDHDPVTLQQRGLLIEESRTNLLLNSATLSTQSATTTAVATTLSFYGTGSITLSGTSTGTTTGTGATTRVTSTFTPTAGTLTLTVSGSVTNAQLEAGAWATSYIPTTGATVTRAADVTTMSSAPFITPQIGSLAVDAWIPQLEGKAQILLGVNASANRTSINISGGNTVNCFDTVSGVNGSFGSQPTTPFKAGIAYQNGTQRACLNGGTVTPFAGATMTAGTTMLIGTDGASQQPTGWIRRARYWAVVLTAAQLQQVTT